MTQLVLHAEEWTASPPSVAYSLFGAGDEAGWLFGAVCDRVEPGAAVRMAVHLSGSGAEPVEILGRIAAARPHAYLDIVHDQPGEGVSNSVSKPQTVVREFGSSPNSTSPDWNG